MTVDTSTRTVSATDPGLTVEVLAEVLFCSNLQPSQRPTAADVLRTLARGLHREGDPVRDCVAELATAYGDDPERACERMRWARSLVAKFVERARDAA